jgi:hypothetical protein
MYKEMICQLDFKLFKYQDWYVPSLQILEEYSPEILMLTMISLIRPLVTHIHLCSTMT